MPIHLAAQPRREFLRRTLLGSAGLLSLPVFGAEGAGVDPHRFALLSDTHIDQDPTRIVREVELASHLRKAVAGVQALPTAPAAVFINGDCSLDCGLAGDYTTLHDLLTPLLQQRLPVHLLLGNHDHREVLWQTLKEYRPATPLVAGRHLSIVEGERANWFLLDSLDVTDQTPGLLGETQRAWLAEALDQRAEKPALVMLHHNPVSLNPQKNTGLIDHAELLALLRPRRQVKAVFFGHTHTWRHTEQDGLHLVNLPAVAYTFAPTEVNGWVDCELSAGGATLRLQAHYPRPAGSAAAPDRLDLTWRA